MRVNTDRILMGTGAVLLAAALSACGSGLGGATGSSSSSSSSSTGSGTKTGTQVGTALVELGNGVGTTYANQQLSITSTNLSAGGTTSISATLVDANSGNALYTAQSVTVTFTSTCVAQGTASFDNSSVATSTGQVSVNYTAKGCAATDAVKATALVGSSTLVATGSITVQAAVVGQIKFVSATPSAISIAGVGGNSSSQVTFQVNDANGNPVPNSTVDFSLITTSGGVTLSPLFAITGSNGQASTFVQAGTVHTSANVKATVRNTSVSTQTPNAIAISTGIPVQTHFSLALATHNLSLAFDHDGTPDAVGVYAVDRYGNPATPGTNILFITNSGVIFGTCPGSTAVTTACGSCQTDASGHCSVTWQSEGNRPLTDTLDVLGHAHILAYTVGEEHYTDTNGNGVFDTSDAFSQCNCILTNTAQGDTFNDGTTLSGDQAPAFDDIGDPYMDSKELGYYRAGEFFADINSSATVRRVPDGKWYGAACGGFGTTTTSVSAVNDPVAKSPETVTCANSLTMIGKDDCLVMSTDGAAITPPSSNPQSPIGHAALVATPLNFTMTDLNGNVIGSGSTVSIVQNNVTGVTLSLSPATSGTTSFTMPDAGCSSNPVTAFTISATPSSTATTFGGSFYLQYTSSDGKTTSTSQTYVIN